MSPTSGANIQCTAGSKGGCRLRKKIAPTGAQLVTLRGLGYLLKVASP